MSVTPLFDQLALERRNPVRPIDRRTTPVLASMVAAPLESGALSREEREIVAEMGDTVAGLLKRMLESDPRPTGRRALHAV